MLWLYILFPMLDFAVLFLSTSGFTRGADGLIVGENGLVVGEIRPVTLSLCWASFWCKDSLNCSTRSRTGLSVALKLFACDGIASINGNAPINTRCFRVVRDFTGFDSRLIISLPNLRWHSISIFYATQLTRCIRKRYNQAALRSKVRRRACREDRRDQKSEGYADGQLDHDSTYYHWRRLRASPCTTPSRE
jgi:hypothetical protein